MDEPLFGLLAGARAGWLRADVRPEDVTTMLLGVFAVLVSTGLLTQPPAASAAVALPSPDTVFQAWNNAFLVQNNGQAYYTDELKSSGTERAGEWVQALDIDVAQDVYDRTHAPADRQLATTLVSTLLADEGTDWASWDTWNDNIAWMLTAVILGYQQTGTSDWLSMPRISGTPLTTVAGVPMAAAVSGKHGHGEQ